MKAPTGAFTFKTLLRHYICYAKLALTLVGAFSVIVKTNCETDGALHSSSDNLHPCQPGCSEDTECGGRGYRCW